MNIDGIQPQTWFAIFAALAAVVIAVVAIVLKRRNDKLRFVLAELNARQQHHSWEPPASEASTAVESSAPQPPPVEPAAVKAVPIEAAPPEAPTIEPQAQQAEVPEPVAAPQDIELRVSSISSRRAEERAIEFTSRQGRRRHPAPTPESLPKFDDSNPREALSEWLNKRAAARTARRTMPDVELPAMQEPAVVAEPIQAASMPTESIDAEPVPVEPTEPIVDTPVHVESIPTEPISDAPVDAEPIYIEPPQDHVEPIHDRVEPIYTKPSRDREEAPSTPAPKQPTVFIDESLWESILGQSSSAKPVRETAPNLRFELIQGAATALPSGLQDEAVLRRLLEANKPFHGLAVALGFSLTDGRALSDDLMLHIEQLVRTLLQDNDFACQTADDEFLLLLPGKQGAEAKARLAAISERLWDFQLRGVGNFSIMVNTGDTQISGEPLSAASVAASARLRQSRRARKPISAGRKSISAVV